MQTAHGLGVADKAQGDTSIAASLDVRDPEQMARLTRHIFPAGISWAPEKMDINGRKGRRVMCVVTQDKKRYRMYDVDSNPEVEEKEDGLDDGSDDIMLEEES